MEKTKTQTEKVSGRFGVTFAMMALLLTVFSGKAQEVYHPITDGCIWSVSNEKYMTVGDTVLDGKTYLKIYRQVGDQPFEFSLEDAEYFAAIRNDSVGKKVYAYLPAGTSIRDFIDYSVIQTDTAMDVLIYDFSLEIGDTLTYYVVGGTVAAKDVAVRAESANIYVGRLGYSFVNHQYSAEDTVVHLSDNSTRHQIFLQGISYYTTKDHVWIEGIGSIRGFDEGTQLTFSDYGQRSLLCFSDNSGTDFQTGFDFDNEPDDCFSNGFGADVPEREKLNVKIYPNPATNILNISVSEIQGGSYSFQLLDVLGNIIYQESFSDIDIIESSIDIKQLPVGIYLVHLQGGDSNYNYKIVKL